MKLSIIGLGLIGGSYGLSLKKRFEDLTIYGWDNDSNHLSRAKELGLIDELCDSQDDAVGKADWVIVAIPVNVIEQELPKILDKIEDGQVVVEMGSTKHTICKSVEIHPRRSQFIAAHPISGTEYSGPDAAFDSLYENKVMIVCEPEKTDKPHIDTFRKQCKVLGMSTTYLGAEEHDVHLAYVSHLSHVISFGLSKTVLEKEEDEDRILDLAGSGFASTVRLAKSSPEMWTPIFMKNRKAVLESLKHYIAHIEGFKDILEGEDEAALRKYLEEGRGIRKILD